MIAKNYAWLSVEEQKRMPMSAIANIRGLSLGDNNAGNQWLEFGQRLVLAEALSESRRKHMKLMTTELRCLMMKAQLDNQQSGVRKIEVEASRFNNIEALIGKTHEIEEEGRWKKKGDLIDES